VEKEYSQHCTDPHPIHVVSSFLHERPSNMKKSAM
jgi:hypothetical protein